ncbi:MAG: EFR1 family ferrodoxin [Paramuribaculum sp.]|nr:EFR1 family ferrodoxin [Paramuribaculum sp.]MDE6322713.1 EFR1 family ferrodoxin [Paramuribaculum sp.]
MIFCFSACGNTALAASLIRKRLTDSVVRITSNTPDVFDVSVHKRIIWTFPIYSWGLPRQVADFISTIELTGAENIPHFMVATCGDDAGLAHLIWKKLIRRRGWHPASAHTVIMPNTYVSLPGFDVDSPVVTARKLAKAPARIDTIAHAIKCGSTIDDVVKGKAAWIKTRIIYPLFMKFMTSPRPFKASSTCNGCGLCSRTCPAANIDIVNMRPRWNNRCTMCLSCYHHCPRKAISYGNATKNKGRYIAPESFADQP